MPKFDSIPAMIDECFKFEIKRQQDWYERYKKTHQDIMADPESERALELLWFTRNNAVSSLQQGNTSKAEFKNAKTRLRALTAKIVASPTSETYEIAIEEVKKLKSEGLFKNFYGALLNRVFAAIIPSVVTSSVKEPAFMQAANFINDYFGLRLRLNGNWFENNVELKNVLRERLPDDYDDFKINIAVWNVYELLEQEKKITDELIETELDKQRVSPLNLTVAQYKEVLQADGVINDNSLALLSAMCASLSPKVTASRLAQELGLPHFGAVNARIGKLSKRIARYFDIEKQDIKNQFTGWWQLVADGERLEEGFSWQLKDNLKIALMELRMINSLMEPSVNEEINQYSTNTSLNQIFYGPPGTGKTYYTIEAAVRAAEPAYTFDSRKGLKAKYDELVDQQRIQFVTFHQSYGYEEFIEGLRAVTEEGQVSYEIQSGIFKRICTLATINMVKSQRTSSISFDACWEVFLNQFDDDEGTQVKTKKSSFRISEITETTIHFEKAQGNSKHSLAIKTLKQVFNGTKVIKGGLNVYYQPLVEHLKSLSANIQNPNEPVKNFVLIIDEINRGNISKIFGELITLIEESKRAFGNSHESVEITLPYSADPFSVPINLHLIGTMNTADRSLAMMDTALRRRFDFVEMMPDYTTLAGVNVKGIALDTLLKRMNARIEALYDREHTLGHAFLIPVKNALLNNGEESAFNLLKATFINKFVPLLEEYFFDDWNKIRLVLGDNQKPEALQFVKKVSYSYGELFGAEHGLETFVEEAQSFHLATPNEDVWKKPEAYLGIFSVVTGY